VQQPIFFSILEDIFNDKAKNLGTVVIGSPTIAAVDAPKVPR